MTLNRLLRRAVLLAAGSYALLYLVVAALRMRYPFELEWLEGGALDHVRRILDGRPIYERPSLDFIAYPYTPLYYYVCAAVARTVDHVSFFPMRLVSFVASMGTFAAILAIVRRETEQWYPALLACGLMAATYGLSGWFDLARVDSLFLAALVWGIYCVQVGSPRALVAGGVCLALACLVKQTALLIAAPVFVWSIAEDRRRSRFLIVPAMIVLGVSAIYLQLSTHGWFWYYAFTLQRKAGTFLPLRVVFFWTGDIFRRTGVAAVFGGWYLVTLARRERPRGARAIAAAGASMIVGAWLSRLRSGNAANVLMPAYAALALFTGLQVADMERRWAASPNRGQRVPQTLMYAACLAQFALLGVDPRRLVPTERDQEAGRRLVGRIASVPGEVFVPCHQYLALLARKRSYAHLQSVFDVLRSGDREVADPLRAELRASFEQRRFDAVLPCGQLRRTLDEAGFTVFYTRQEAFFEPSDRTFLTKAGVPLRPEALYVPARPHD